MPKKKEKPEIEHKEYFKVIDKNNLPNDFFRRGTSKLNAAITRQGWFLRSPFFESLKEQTRFLDENCTISERFYCFLNGIKERVVSPISGKPLNFSKQKNEYCIGATSKECALLRKDGSKKASTKKREENKKLKFELFNNTEFTLLSKERLKKYIDGFYKDGVCVGRITSKQMKDNVDELCSLIHYTKKYSSFIEDNDWSQRMYIVYYDKEEYLNDFFNKYQTLPKYYDFFKGYGSKPKYKNLSKKETNKMLWRKVIEKQGFDIIKENYDEDNIHRRTVLKCQNCGHIFDRNLSSGLYMKIYCPKCQLDASVSKIEKRLREEISTLYKGKVMFNDRQTIGKELDIYFPEKKLAIEVNGVLWHSFGKTFPNNVDKESGNKTNHYEKYKLCSDKDIKLLQFTDKDVEEKHDIVLGMIKSNLGVFEKRVYARQCDVRKIDKKTKSEFCNTNHLHGNAGSRYDYGLYYNGDLVSVMTFGVRGITKGDKEMEIIRFCSKLGYQIVGGASKLFSHFIKEYKPKKVITYSDNAISNGAVYEKLGFERLRETRYNYWYLDPTKRKLLHRSNFMKHKLNTLLTEREEMYDRGYRRYYDAGNKVFSITF